MSKAKFAEAKALIDAKRYAEARSLLKTIDHPTAREWEAKLDKFDLPTAKPKGNGRRVAIIAGGVVILIMVVYMAGGGAEGLANRRSTQTAAAVVAIVTQDAAATSIALTPPTATDAPADTVTPSATATITDTPEPSATATVDPLGAALLEVEGVVSIDMVAVLGETVYIEATVETGYSSNETAAAMKAVAASVLVSASLEFSAILYDGTTATDYVWSNRTDSWTETRLSVTPIR